MEYWLGEFRSAFFAEWERAGLSPPDQTELTKAPMLGALQNEEPSVQLDIADSDGPISEALSDQIVTSVHRFGREIGEVCSMAVGASVEETAASHDWCGRFNLGISLFDFVCDELPGQLDVLINAPAFAPFAGKDPAAGATIDDPVVRALDSLAGEVLRDLERMIGPRTASSRRSGVWRALDSMFAAQVQLSIDGANRSPTEQLLDGMRLKSAEPFRIMAEYVGYGAGLAPGSRRRLANFGRAIGDCFWIVDDAVDVWTDLDHGRSNYFLSMALAADHSLDLTAASPVVDARLGRIWRVAELAQTASRRLSRNVATALHRLDPAEADWVSERLATSIARWST